MKFKKPPSRPNFPEMEKAILKYWEENKIFEQSVERPAPSGDFVFYEGPPTANGRPGVHHIEARAFKDLFPRYRTMQGFRVKRRAGWDTHGLPVELEVEKLLGFSGKRDIEKYGVVKFNKKCAASVWKYKAEWEELTKRIGYWLDLRNPYITCSNEYISAVWGILQKIWQKGLLYQGHKVLPYCPRCGTALSSHEVAQGYRRVEEESVYVKFKVKSNSSLDKGRAGGVLGQEKKPPLTPLVRGEGQGIYFLAWTTTPWTLPGNVALALGGEIEYALIASLDKGRAGGVMNQCNPPNPPCQGGNATPQPPRSRGEYLILAKKRLEILDGEYEIIQEFKGRDLEGLEYEPLYSVFEKEETPLTPLIRGGTEKNRLNKGEEKKRVYTTVLADFVTTSEGTGIVHTAVMYGEDDYELGKKLGLPMVHTVDEQGKFNLKSQISNLKSESKNLNLKIVAQFLEKIDGQFVKDAEKEITEDLRARGLLYKLEMFTHDYPFCWRCRTPLLYYAKQSWFIAMSKLRRELVKNNAKVNWIPSYLKHGRFGKWISEARDWAISRERYWGTPLPVWQCQTGNFQFSIFNFQTNLKSKISNSKQCGNIKVIGSAQELEKLSGKKLQDLHRPYIDEIVFPCEKCGGEMRRVPEVLDCWFDSGSMPFASAEAFPADFICEAVDQTRGWFYTLLAIATALGRGPAYKNVISLGHVLDEKGQKMSKSRGNVIDPFRALDQFGADSIRWFFYTVNKPQESKNFDPQVLREIISRFILTIWNSYSFFATYAAIDRPVLRPLAGGVPPLYRGGQEGFNPPNPRGLGGNETPLTPLVRGGGNILDRWILSRFSELNKKVVQHLDKYNVLQAAKEMEKFTDDLSNWYIRRSRRRFWKNENDQDKKAGYETLYFVLVNLTKMLAPFMPFLAEEIYQGLTAKKSVHLARFPRPIAEHLDQDLMTRMEETRRIVNLGLKLRAKAGIKVRQTLAVLNLKSKIENVKSKSQISKLFDLIKEEVNVKEIKVVAKFKKNKDWIVASDGDLEAALNIKITPELKREGFARDLVRAIQEERKKANLKVTDRIILALDSDDLEIRETIAEWRKYICKETLAGEILNKIGKADYTEKMKVGGKNLKFKIEKVKSTS